MRTRCSTFSLPLALPPPQGALRCFVRPCRFRAPSTLAQRLGKRYDVVIGFAVPLTYVRAECNEDDCRRSRDFNNGPLCSLTPNRFRGYFLHARRAHTRTFAGQRAYRSLNTDTRSSHAAVPTRDVQRVCCIARDHATDRHGDLDAGVTITGVRTGCAGRSGGIP